MIEIVYNSVIGRGAFESWYFEVCHSSPRSSTSKMRVALGGIVHWSQGSTDVSGTSSLITRPPSPLSATSSHEMMKRLGWDGGWE